VLGAPQPVTPSKQRGTGPISHRSRPLATDGNNFRVPVAYFKASSKETMTTTSGGV